MNMEEMRIRQTLSSFKYWKDEYSLKNNMFRSIETVFNDALNEFLEKNPDIKKKWDEFMELKTDKIDNFLKSESVTFEKEEETTDVVLIEPKKENKTAKKLYRDIAKVTHPDMIAKYLPTERKKRLEIYIESTRFYQDGDVFGLVYHADSLGVPYEIVDLDVDKMKKEIERYKQLSSMYENTFYWRWYTEEGNKDALIGDYLVKQMV